MIEIKSLEKKYGSRTVLSIDSLSIDEGESVVIIGPNGSGKTTLLRILAGTLKPDGGSFGGCGSVLYLPQQSTAFDKTVEKNILFGARGEKEKARQRTAELMILLQLDSLKDKKATTLSGGELQKTALCRLLINDCELLILDEPTNAADIEGAELIRRAVLEYKARNGCTLIMTTHSPAEAKAMASRIIMLHDGRVIEDGSPEKLLENPSTEWGRKFISQWKL